MSYMPMDMPEAEKREIIDLLWNPVPRAIDALRSCVPLKPGTTIAYFVRYEPKELSK